MNKICSKTIFLFFIVALLISPKDTAAKTKTKVDEENCIIYIDLYKEFFVRSPQSINREIEYYQNKIAELGNEIGQLESERRRVQDRLERTRISNQLLILQHHIGVYNDGLTKAQETLEEDAAIRAGLSDEDITNKIEAWKREIENVWNPPGYDYDCCKVKITFHYSLRDENAEPSIDEEYDQIEIRLSDNYRSNINGFENWNNGFSPDPYNKNMGGAWRFGTNPGYTAPHEAGHEMGLDDEYKETIRNRHRTSKAKKNHGNDIMGTSAGGRQAVSVSSRGVKIDNIREILTNRNIACPKHCCKKTEQVQIGDVIFIPLPRESVPKPVAEEEHGGTCEGTKPPETSSIPETTMPETETIEEQPADTFTEEISKQQPIEQTEDSASEKQSITEEDGTTTSTENVQYKKIEEGNVTCDTGILYRETPEGMDIEVSALPTGKGINFRQWEITDIKLKIDGTTVKAKQKENFYVSKESIFKNAAVVALVAIGSQYEQCAKEAESGEVCPVTGKKISAASQEKQRGAVAKSIDKAGMVAGMGLLVSQSKGEITGAKYTFSLDKDLAGKIDGNNDTINLSAENKTAHQKEKIKTPLEPVK
ncbi:MAG: hypothetical protein ABH836_01770 [Candidatus Omnitrophota bacterium]